MEIVLKDIDGNEILSPELTQWDQGVDVIVRNFRYTADQVHFHFYNDTKTQIVEVTPELYTDSTGAPCLRGAVPNILLQEPYSIIMHVYISDGGDSINTQAHITAQTVFTAKIHVEPRMRPDNFVPLDNTGAMTIAEIRDDFGQQLANWGAQLSAFYGSTPIPTVTVCYNPSNQKMYANRLPVVETDVETGAETIVGYTYTEEITPDTGVFYTIQYEDGQSVLAFYEDEQFVEWTVSGAINYCKSRADACDTARSTMDATYNAALDTKETALENTLKAGLGNCVVRTSTSAPTVSDYAAVQTALAEHPLLQGLPIITFVVEEGI